MKATTLKRGKHYRTTHVGRGKDETPISVTRFKNPYDNLLYNVLLQAVRDNDIDYLKHGDGVVIWQYLKGVKTT